MHTFWLRGNGFLFFGLSVLFGLSCMCAVSTVFMSDNPTVTVLRVNQVRELRHFGRIDRALVSFDLSADLSSVFNWNVKQLFLMVVAEYSTPTNKRNEVVLWDLAVRSPQEAKLNLQNVFNKYALIDQFDELRGTKVTLKLVYDVMPYTGLLSLRRHRGEITQLPHAYR